MTLLVERGLRCRWCGRRFRQTAGAGRPREYCRRSCRQRDYEARRRANELGLGEHELIVTRHELDELRDRLSYLGDTVAEVERDLADADAGRLLDILVDAAKHAGLPLRATHGPTQGP